MAKSVLGRRMLSFQEAVAVIGGPSIEEKHGAAVCHESEPPAKEARGCGPIDGRLSWAAGVGGRDTEASVVVHGSDRVKVL